MVTEAYSPALLQAFRDAQSNRSVFRKEDVDAFLNLFQTQYAQSANHSKNDGDNPLTSADDKTYWEKREENQKKYMELAKDQILKQKMLQLKLARKALTKPVEGKSLYLAGISAAELFSI